MTIAIISNNTFLLVLNIKNLLFPRRIKHNKIKMFSCLAKPDPASQGSGF